MALSSSTVARASVTDGFRPVSAYPDASGATLGRSAVQSAANIFVIARERGTADEVAAFGSGVGWFVRWESSVAPVRDALSSDGADLVLIDLPLPHADARSLCTELESTYAVRILVLTPKGDPDACISLLESGADDCLVKPYKLAELTARMGALLRRSAMAAKYVRYDVGDIRVDLMKRDVTVADRSVRLREKEFDLLLELARRAGSVVSRQTLLERVWGFRDAMSGDTLDVHIHRLRRKLGDLHSEQRRIETVWGVGYRLCV